MRRMHAPAADSAGVATAAEREPAQSVMARRRLVLKTEIIISAVWLRRSGDNAEVLVERDGKWYKAITVVYPQIVYTDLNRLICKIWVPSLARRA
jgi:hypothetical protein